MMNGVLRRITGEAPGQGNSELCGEGESCGKAGKRFCADCVYVIANKECD